MAGLRVVVLERRAVVGGAAVTEEFHPGFRNSVAAYTVSLLNPKVIRDLDLAAHGLRIVERKLANFLPLEDGRYLAGRRRPDVCGSRQVLPPDAERLDAYHRRLDAVADVLRELVLRTPPNVVEGKPFAALSELIKAATLARRVRRGGLELRASCSTLFTASAGHYLDGWFESAPIKAAVRVRRHRRQLRQPLRGGLGLRAAAPLLRRGERQEGAVGPRDRRHGRDHRRRWRKPRRERRRDPASSAVREVIVDKGRRAGVVTAGGATCARRSSPTSIPSSSIRRLLARRPCRPNSAGAWRPSAAVPARSA